MLTVGEMPGVTIPEAVLVHRARPRRELDMVFQFEHVELDHGADRYHLRPLQLAELKASLAAWQAGLAGRGWNSLYWGNHDQPRSLSRFGDDGAHRVASAKTLATVLHLHQGTPYVYQGDEMGMANAPFTRISDLRDIQTLNYYAEAAARGDADLPALLPVHGRSRAATRPGPRSSGTARPEPASPAGTPWIGINPDHAEVNAAAEVGQPGSVFEHYRQLIELRHADPVVTDGAFELLLPDHPAIWAFLRRGPGHRAAGGGELLRRGGQRGAAAGRRLGRRGRRAEQPDRPGAARAAAWPAAPALGIRHLAPRPLTGPPRHADRAATPKDRAGRPGGQAPPVSRWPPR